jgi:hypothetical protein
MKNVKKKERNFQTQNAQPVAWHSAGFQAQATYKYLSSTTNYIGKSREVVRAG